MPTWTTFADVTTRWVGSGVPTSQALVEALLNDAETVIKAEFPLIQDRITAGTLLQSTVKLVSCRMVTRVLRNPENVAYLQQNTGPFGQARNFGDKVDIWLSDDERQLLTPTRRGKAFSVDMAPNKTSALFPSDIPTTIDRVWVVTDFEP
jgi:hypothetical protein